MKVRASLKKRTPDCKIVMAVCMLLIRKILSINNVKDNLFIIFAEKII